MSASDRPTTVRPSFRPAVLTDSREAGTLLLRDGTRLKLSRALPEDAERVRAFVQRLSSAERLDVMRSLNLARGKLAEFLEGLGSGDHAAAFLVQGEDEEKVAAFAAYRLVEGVRDTACVGLAVAPRWRTMGVATLLLERVAVLAARQGVARMVGVSQTDNAALIALFRASGFEPDVRVGKDSARFLISTKAQAAREGLPQRITSRTFVAASLRPFFHPRSVAVVGASRDPSSLGHRIVASLVDGGFNGPVFPVNPAAEHIHSIQAYPSVGAIRQPVDLAVIVAPAEVILKVVDDCAAAGVQALIVITGHFSEAGPKGAERERALAEKVREKGLRMLGPNCMGMIHSDPKVRLNASLSTEVPEYGPAALCSQSGALGIAVTALAKRLGLGLSSFVSVGNRSDVTGNDLLEYWEEDDRTRVILFYLESFGNPRRFARLARRVGRSKPIVAVKGGRSRAGRRGSQVQAASHRVANIAVDALFSQTGVIRADNLDDMFDVARALATQPLPRGRRVALVTNAGGPAILAADAIEAAGLRVEPLAPATVTALQCVLPDEAQTRNPVDMLAASSPATYRRTVELLLAAEEVDVLVVIYTPVGMADTDEVSRAVAAGVDAARATGRANDKTVLASVVGENERSAVLVSPRGEVVPVYCFPETMGRLLGKITAYSEWRRSDTGVFPEYRDQRLAAARKVCERVLKQRGGDWLEPEEVQKVLGATGLLLAESVRVSTAAEAIAAASSLGYPVALRLVAADAEHRTERGGVHLGLESDRHVEEAFTAVAEVYGDELASGDGRVIVQRMVSDATEVAVTVRDDLRFGPLISFALGGIFMEAVSDVAFRVSPLTDVDARGMIREVRGSALLDGYRGHPAGDIASLEELLLRVSRLVEAVPAIARIQLDPVLVLAPGEGYRIAEARIRLQQPAGE